MNSYIDWFKIIGLAVGLMNTVTFSDSFYVTQKWISLKDLSLESNEADSALLIKLKLKGNYPQEVSKTIVLVPRVEIYPKIDENSISILPSLYTVTKDAVVFQYIESDTVEKTLQETGIFDSLDTLFQFKLNQTAEENPKNKIPEGYQTIKFNSYPNYVDINIAKPGSKPVDLKEISDAFPGKMIHVTVTPDMGKVMSYWVKGKTDPNNDVNLIQSKISGALERCKENSNEENRKNAYIDANNEIDGVLNKYLASYDADKEYYQDLLKRYLLIRGKVVIYPTMEGVFGDYQPKLTPDSATDYMPSIAETLDSLPSATEENIVVLAQEFIKYQKLVSKNPGEWIEGNVILGAKPKEYKATKDELILNEIGNRMNEVLKNTDYKILQKQLKDAGIKQDKFEYTNFTFIHMDVMGSGRFFYVENMEKKCLTITK